MATSPDPSSNSAIHVVPGIARGASGPSYSVVRLCESLIKQGQQISLVAGDWGDLVDCPIFIRTFPLGLGPRRFGRSPRMKQWLTEQAKAKRVEILHNHGMWQMNSVYPGQISSCYDVKLIVSPRGAFSSVAMANGSKLKRIAWPILQRPAVNAASCFHATCEAEYFDIRRLGFKQPVAIIPNGIDIPSGTFPSSNIASSERILLYLGRIHPIKGLDLLLAAWRLIQNEFPEWKLVIAGNDHGYYGATGYLAELLKLRKSFALERIEFVGELQGSDKQAAYAAAEIFVLPSYSESFGVAVAEALSFKIPAIASTRTPWSGLVQNRAGWCVEPTVNALSQCLQTALSRPPETLKQMGVRGYNWMRTEYSWSKVARDMTATYSWLRNKTDQMPGCVYVD